MIVDCHSHILPGIDDGSKNPEESEKLITSLKEVGIDHVVLTPHYYVYDESVSDFIKKRNSAFDILRALPAAEGMSFSLASEVYLMDLVLNVESLSELSIGNSPYILLELPPEKHFSNSTQKNIDRIFRFGLTPVLAHIDRYPDLWDPDLVDELREMGCLIQINISSLAFRKVRKKMLWLLDYDMIDFFGNDLHHDPFDKEGYLEAISVLRKLYSRADIEYLNNRAIEKFFYEAASN